MRKSLSQVPVGVWVGVVVLLASAWIKDGWGFVLGAIIIGATIATTSYQAAEAEKQAAADAEPEDDGWGSEPETSAGE